MILNIYHVITDIRQLNREKINSVLYCLQLKLDHDKIWQCLKTVNIVEINLQPTKIRTCIQYLLLYCIVRPMTVMNDEKISINCGFFCHRAVSPVWRTSCKIK